MKCLNRQLIFLLTMLISSFASTEYITISQWYGSTCQGSPYTGHYFESDLCYPSGIYYSNKYICISGNVTSFSWNNNLCRGVPFSNISTDQNCNSGIRYTCSTSAPSYPSISSSSLVIQEWQASGNCQGTPTQTLTYLFSGCTNTSNSQSNYYNCANGVVTSYSWSNSQTCSGMPNSYITQNSSCTSNKYTSSKYLCSNSSPLKTSLSLIVIIFGLITTMNKGSKQNLF